MSEIPRPLSLTAGGVNRDYQAIFTDLLGLIPQITPEWTYQGEDDLGVALLQLVSYTADHLHYRADTTLRDMLPGSTQDREVLRELAAWLGYQARRADAAQAAILFSLTTALTEDISIPAGTKLQGSSGDATLTFETDDPVTMVAGATSLAVSASEGLTIGPVLIGTATGTPRESFKLGDANAIYSGNFDDLRVFVDGDEATWTQLGVKALPYALAFWVREVKGGDLEVRFGDGSAGRTLTAGSSVTVIYRRGNGVVGRFPANSIVTLLDSFTTSTGATVPFTVTNPFRAFGGNDAEDTELLRSRAPEFFASQSRAVTLNDYSFYAVSTPGVLRSRALRTGVNGVAVFVIPDGASEGAVFTAEALLRIQRIMDNVRMASNVVAVKAASLVPIDVTIDVHAFPNVRNADVRQAVVDRFIKVPTTINDASRDPLSLRGVDGGILHEVSNDLGQHLRESDMIHSVELVNGVDYLDTLVYTRRPTVLWRTQAGDAVFGDVTISSATVREVWSIVFTSDTEFRADGSVSGEQTAAGSLGVVYTSDNSEVSFTITAGVVAMSQGDLAHIFVGSQRGNIQLRPGEFPVPGNLAFNVTGGI